MLGPCNREWIRSPAEAGSAWGRRQPQAVVERNAALAVPAFSCGRSKRSAGSRV